MSKALVSFFCPSPLEGEGAPKGRMRGALSFSANLHWRVNLRAPLIRLFAAAKTHLLPQGEKGSPGKRFGWSHTHQPQARGEGFPV